jgi:O-succinylbenzoic acid--CoA ligase
MDSRIRKLITAIPFAPGPLLPMEDDAAIVPVETKCPHTLLATLLQAWKRGLCPALMDPDWPERWKHHLLREIEMNGAALLKRTGLDNHGRHGILLATGGTTGCPKLCLHSLDTLWSAAMAYSQWPAARKIKHAVIVLPLWHISGLMPLLRSAAMGGQIWFSQYSEPASLLKAPTPLRETSISLVPLQLKRLLRRIDGRTFLSRCGLILLGGASADSELLKSARHRQLRLAPCYGSTETAAMVTALSPSDFLAGHAGVGQALPHAGLSLDHDAQLIIEAPSIFHGYLNEKELSPEGSFRTADRASVDKDGFVHLLGRTDAVINSGGKKVHPEMVRRAALATGHVTAAACFAKAHPDWGEQIELRLRPESPRDFDEKAFRKALRTYLPAYAIPKKIHLEAD